MPSGQSLLTGTGVLATVALGLASGSVLAEGAVVVPWWRAVPPADFLVWYSFNAASLFNYFGTLEIVSAALAIVAAALALFRRAAGARLFLASAVLAVAVLVLFPLYFERVNARFTFGTIPVEDVPAELARWARWHWVRTVLESMAFVAAVLGVRAAGRGA